MDLAAILREITEEMRAETDKGRVAGYIPELGCIDPDQFGIAVWQPEGEVLVSGDADTPFSIQSISKVFTLTLAMETLGEALWHRVGFEPSGDPFNSIVQLEAERGKPRNPLINAGAIVVADCLLAGRTPAETMTEIESFVRKAASDTSITTDPAVARSETLTGQRNRALANFMAAERNLQTSVEDVLEVYFTQCALALSCRQLAKAGRYLAMSGCVEGKALIPAHRVRQILALMLTCGHYDGSGAFAYRVGIPGKSGVGGGILAIVPGKASIAVWSPGLGAKGNSLLGTRALERLAARTGWSVFGP